MCQRRVFNSVTLRTHTHTFTFGRALIDVFSCGHYRHRFSPSFLPMLQVFDWIAATIWHRHYIRILVSVKSRTKLLVKHEEVQPSCRPASSSSLSITSHVCVCICAVLVQSPKSLYIVDHAARPWLFPAFEPHIFIVICIDMMNMLIVFKFTTVCNQRRWMMSTVFPYTLCVRMLFESMSPRDWLRSILFVAFLMLQMWDLSQGAIPFAGLTRSYRSSAAEGVK